MTFNLNVMILGLCTAAGLMAADVTSAAGTPKQTADQLLAEAKATRVASLDLATQLKAKNANLAKVTDDVAAIEKSAGAIHSLVQQLESHKSQLTPRQQAELTNVKQLSELLHVFLDNKKTLVAHGAGPEDRERIRLYAKSVADRAEMLEKTLRRMAM